VIRPPEVAGRWALAGGALVWVVVAIARAVGPWAIPGTIGVGVAVILLTRRQWAVAVAGLMAAAAVSGMLSSAREASVLQTSIESGPVELAGIALDDVRRGASGLWFLMEPTHAKQQGVWIEWPGPPVLVSLRDEVDIAARDVVVVSGVAVSRPGMARGDPYAGVIRRARVASVAPSSDLLFVAGNAVRARIHAGLGGGGAERALVSGFLIGDVRELPAVSADQLRRSGLSHFIAVSGSNVALFLILWWVIVGPFAFGPRRRAIAGLVGLAIFIVVTRWEPSVLRAAGMAGLLLVSRALGVALTPWVALGPSVGGLLLVSGELSGDVGFQLSVAATAGVMAGADIFRDRLPRWIGAPLGATVAAQIAVAPVLLVHFGTIPLLSPLANLAAAPLVMVSTAAGGIGVLSGIGVLTNVGLVAAKGVLAIAEIASGWPQLGPVAAILVIIGGMLLGYRRLRPLVVIGAAFTLLVSVAGHRFEPPAAVFLDVGQGDAEVIVGPSGETILIDGGPDPVVILRKLEEYRIDRVDVMVLSHPHDDHATGLVAVIEHLPVGALWESGYRGGGPAAEELLSAAEARRIPVLVPVAGDRFRVGVFTVEVLGPLRRYASPNDQSLVLRVDAMGTSMLFPGDAEKIAQRELGTLHADVLKVPHQGAATSDLSWLVGTGAREAIISVGPNTFGHPSDSIIAGMEAAGMLARRTDEEGDIVVPFGASSRSP
jgi:competence protein ComEC